MAAKTSRKDDSSNADAKPNDAASTRSPAPPKTPASSKPSATPLSSTKLEAAILNMMKAGTRGKSHTPELLRAKLQARTKKTVSPDAVDDALASLVRNKKIERDDSFKMKTVTRGVRGLAMTDAAGGTGVGSTGVQLDVEDFVRVALRALPGGWVTPQQVKVQVDTLQPGFDLEDISIALDMLFLNGEIRKSNDGRSYCDHGCV